MTALDTSDLVRTVLERYDLLLCSSKDEERDTTRIRDILNDVVPEYVLSKTAYIHVHIAWDACVV